MKLSMFTSWRGWFRLILRVTAITFWLGLNKPSIAISIWVCLWLADILVDIVTEGPRAMTLARGADKGSKCRSCRGQLAYQFSITCKSCGQSEVRVTDIGESS